MLPHSPMYEEGLSTRRGESDLPAGGQDLFIVEVAGYAAGPGGQRFRDCSETPVVVGGDGHRRRATLPNGVVRRRNKRDLPFLYCALGIHGLAVQVEVDQPYHVLLG